jgi:hypothetical protein
MTMMSRIKTKMGMKRIKTVKEEQMVRKGRRSQRGECSSSMIHKVRRPWKRQLI